MKKILYVVSAIGFGLVCWQSCSKKSEPTTLPTIYTDPKGTVKDVDGNAYDELGVKPVTGIVTGVSAGNNATLDTTATKDPAKPVTAPAGTTGTIVSTSAKLIPAGIQTLSANLKSAHYADGKALVSTPSTALGGTLAGKTNPHATGVTILPQGSHPTTITATESIPSKSCYNNSSLNCDSIGALYSSEGAIGLTFEQLIDWNSAQGDKNGDGYIDLSDDTLNQPADARNPYGVASSGGASQFIGTAGEGLWAKNAVVQKGPQGACPQGYHIPTDGEWKQLEMALGMPKYDVDKEGMATDRGSSTQMGQKLITALGLKYGGYTSVNNTYAQLGEVDIFWTATAGIDAFGPYVYVRYIYKNQFKGVIRARHYQKSGLSVRCFKDL